MFLTQRYDLGLRIHMPRSGDMNLAHLCTSPKAVHKWGDRIEIVPKTWRPRILLISDTLRRVRKLASGARSSTK